MKGHPLRGLFGGFVFGLLLAITLWYYGAIDFHSNVMWILPLVFLVIGLALAAWAPFGSGGSAETATAEGVSYAAAGDADTANTLEQTLEQPPTEPPPTPGTHDRADDEESGA